ncbi:M20 family metallopeptidase [Agromyces italicus]|uniref:M20 family metallopeptidase n=1 Tax=Agromyces italicus TaxID=279572 RepID=UPI0003B33D9E|nr:M20 family metallopeptidase [Agromyces italicus]
MPKPVQSDDIISTIRSLVECESPSSDLAAVASSADLVAQLGEAILGAAAERIEINGVSHLRWRFGDTTEVLLLTHHDTVWPLGTLDRLPYSIDDGNLAGPGCFDMKTGLAMAMHAIVALDDRNGVTLLVTGDEELGSPSSRTLIEDTAQGARAVLVFEASADGGALKLERKGVSVYEVVLGGTAAHAGLEPEKGVNTSIELAHQVLAITALANLDLGTTVTPTLAVSGVTSNTVPARATLKVDVRARTAIEQQRIEKALRELRPVLNGASIEVLGGVNRPPLERSASIELFGRVTALAAKLGLKPIDGVSVGGASDGNYTAGIGVPTLDGLGAVGGGAHAESEHVVVAEIEPRTRLLCALLTELVDEAKEGRR